VRCIMCVPIQVPINAATNALRSTARVSRTSSIHSTTRAGDDITPVATLLWTPPSASSIRTWCDAVSVGSGGPLRRGHRRSAVAHVADSTQRRLVAVVLPRDAAPVRVAGGFGEQVDVADRPLTAGHSVVESGCHKS
jgi:hypothetical protein